MRHPSNSLGLVIISKRRSLSDTLGRHFPALLHKPILGYDHNAVSSITFLIFITIRTQRSRVAFPGVRGTFLVVVPWGTAAFFDRLSDTVRFKVVIWAQVDVVKKFSAAPRPRPPAGP